MTDKDLVRMASLIVLTYLIYMTVGPGGDGIIFGSVVGAICLLAGVKAERFRAQSISPSCQTVVEEEAQS